MIPITGFEGLYSVTKDGRIFSHHSNRFLKPSAGKPKYLKIALRKNKENHFFRVHRLVASAFIENPNRLPCVNHKNGDKLDNRVENLEWCTYSENNKHAWDTGLNKYDYDVRGEKNGGAILNDKKVREIRKLRTKGMTLKAIGTVYGVSFRTVWDITTGRRWSHVT